LNDKNAKKEGKNLESPQNQASKDQDDYKKNLDISNKIR
jgi:hypothetical protein